MAAWLGAGMHGEMGYLEKRAELRAGPLGSENLLAGARSVVVVALSYDLPAPELPKDAKARGVIARYARGHDYHPLMWEKLKNLGAFIEAEWPGEKTRGFADSNLRFLNRNG